MDSDVVNKICLWDFRKLGVFALWLHPEAASKRLVTSRTSTPDFDTMCECFCDGPFVL